MDVFPLLFFAFTIALSLCALFSHDNRSVWQRISRKHAVTYLALAPLAVIVSLSYFDAIDAHAWRPHEESLLFALAGDGDSDGIRDSLDDDVDGDGVPNVEDSINDIYHPLEVQPLLKSIYSSLGRLLGTGPPDGPQDWDALKYAFMATALLLGIWSATLLATTGHLLSGRFAVGLGVGILLLCNPTLAYWRTNAFHVAISHVAFSSTLLAASLLAFKQSRLNYGTWFVLGAMTLYLRPEQSGAVLGTVAIPLLCGSLSVKALVMDWRRWSPGFAVSLLCLAPHTISMYKLAIQRGDYQTGMRFGPLHLSVPELWEPMTYPGFALLVVLGIVTAFLPKSRVPNSLRRPAAAFTVIAALSAFPSLFFMSFGCRHLLNMATACTILAVLGITLVAHVFSDQKAVIRGLIVMGIGLGCLGPVLLSSHGKLQEWGARYGVTNTASPTLPNTPAPSATPPQFDPQTCATYSADWKLCNQDVWPWCHPPKDLRDPDIIRERWDQYGGCVVWGIEEEDGQVAGTRHEWWMVVRGLYSWEPIGMLQVEDEGLVRQVDVYQMTQRP